MGRYASVRGWVECSFEIVPHLKNITTKYLEKYSEYSVNDDIVEAYIGAWKFPDNPLNWTAYIFYGADIRDRCLDFIKDQLIEMVNLEKDIIGIFYVDIEDTDIEEIWHIKDGILKEIDRRKLELP